MEIFAPAPTPLTRESSSSSSSLSSQQHPSIPGGHEALYRALHRSIVRAVFVLQPVVAKSEAHISLRIHSDKGVCYKNCPKGQFCPNSLQSCRAPKGSECFNPATGEFISKCDKGFKCQQGKCVYA